MSTTEAKRSGPDFNVEGMYIRFSDILGPLVEEVGISREALTDPNVLVPLDKHCRLLELAAQRRKDDFVGLKVGYQVHPRDMGPLGYTILNSPTVLAALQSFVRYLGVYARGCEFDLQIEGESAFFKYSYTFTEPCAIERRQEAECTLAMVKQALEVITSKKLELEAVCFEHPKPGDTSKHKQIFAAPLYFSQEVNSLKFKASILQREAAHAEHRLFEVLEKHLAEVINTQVDEDDLVAKVGNAIAQSLSNGVPSIDDVAATLDEVGQELGIGRERVRQIQNTALHVERKPSVNDRPYGAIPGSAYWRHPMIGLMEPPDDRPNGATPGSA
jgi:hypothetical protein